MNRGSILLAFAVLAPSLAGAADRSALRQLRESLPEATTLVLEAPKAEAAEAVAISWEDAAGYVDKRVSVEGPIVGSWANDKVCFLNFSEDYASNLTLVIFASAFKAFPPGASVHYRGKVLRAEGTILRASTGQLQLVLNSPSQLRVISEGTSSIVNWEDVSAADEGKVISVEGVVMSVKRTEKVAFLNFHQNWTRYVAGVIFADQEKGREAAERAETLIKRAKRVEFLTRGEPDKYGRMLGFVILDGELLAVSMIEAGLAYETVSGYGDNGFPEEAKAIEKAWGKGKELPFLNPGEWRKRYQVHELSVPRKKWDAMSEKERSAVLRKVREAVEGRGAEKPRK